jgi:hypothetical protein
MLRRVPGVAAPARTFAALTVALAVSLTPAAQSLPRGPVRPDAAGGTVTETITSAYRTGR